MAKWPYAFIALSFRYAELTPNGSFSYDKFICNAFSKTFSVSFWLHCLFFGGFLYTFHNGVTFISCIILPPPNDLLSLKKLGFGKSKKCFDVWGGASLANYVTLA